MVARSPVRHVHPLGPLQRPGPPRMGDGGRRHPRCRIRAARQTFKPKPNAARAWAKLAKQAGQKYMVMTTKHHEGFCQFDTKLTDYCAPKQGPGRDLVAEYVEAARAEGLRVGFYYSLMDWHHPDGARCATDEAGAPPLRRLHPRPDPRAADQLRQDRRPLVRRGLAAGRQGLGIGKDERDGVPASAGHHRQQPQPAGRRFRHSGAAHRGRQARLGILHDDER